MNIRRCLVCLILLLCMTTWIVPAAAMDANDELRRAVSLGIVSEHPDGESVTANALFRMPDAAEVRVFLLRTDSFTPLCDCRIR